MAGNQLFLDAVDLFASLLAKIGVPHGNRAAVDRVVFHDAVPVAQCPAETVAAIDRGYVAAGFAGHVIEIGLVRGQRMISVDAVFGEQFPVGLDGIAVGTGEHFHPFRRLIGNQIEVFGGAGQVIAQGSGVRVETHEDEALVALVARGAQAEIGAVEIGSVTLNVGHPDQLAGGVETPGVVETLEHLGVAMVGAADERPAMRAGVVEHAQLTMTVPGEEQSPLGNHPTNVVSRVRHFRLVSQVEPATIEDTLPLQLVDVGRHHTGTVHLEFTQIRSVVHQVTDVHQKSPQLRLSWESGGTGASTNAATCQRGITGSVICDG